MGHVRRPRAVLRTVVERALGLARLVMLMFVTDGLTVTRAC